MDNFQFFTEEDKQQASYAVCMAGWVASGMMVGSAAPALGTLGGAAAGALWGFATCKKLQAPIRQKLFSQGARLSEHEILAALKIIREQNPGISKKAALDLLAQARHEMPKNPRKYA